MKILEVYKSLHQAKKELFGTRELNKKIQSLVNPEKSNHKKEKSIGDTVFREGDSVMQIKNNYDIEWEQEDGELGSRNF